LTWLQDYFNAVQFAGGSPNVAVRYLPLMLSGTARQWINDLVENSIQTWFNMQTAFTENFEGTYKRPHNIGDLQRCRRADDETSQTFLARWLDMKNSCEGVTDESAILAFIDSSERGQLLRHRLLRERNEGKLTLNSMITIASNYAAADDDARESLKASAIQNTGKRNSSNKCKNPPEERRLRTWWPQPSLIRVKTASAAEDAAVAADSRGVLQLPLWRHPLPCLTTNTAICHVLPIMMLQESATTPTGTASL
jgi:hypothetical protein